MSAKEITTHPKIIPRLHICSAFIGEDLLGESNPLDGVTHRGLAENWVKNQFLRLRFWNYFKTRTRNFYKLCCCCHFSAQKSWQKSFKKLAKMRAVQRHFLKPQQLRSNARKNDFIWKSLNMAFLRFLLVINVNIPAWAMLGDLLERQVSSSVFNFQVLNVTQEDKSNDNKFFDDPVFL
jgi:hypothetical protein